MGSQRVHERVRDRFARVRESSREFVRVRESSREFARVRESSREFARVRESSQKFAKVRKSSRRMRADGFIAHIRRIRGLAQNRERIHSGFTRVLTQCSQFTGNMTNIDRATQVWCRKGVGVQMHTWTNGPPIALVRDPRSRIASASVENWPPVSGETPLSWYEYCSPLAGAYCRTVLVRHCDGTRTGTLYSYNL